MEKTNENLQEEIVNAAATKAAEFTNSAVETKTEELKSEFNTKLDELTEQNTKTAALVEKLSEKGIWAGPSIGAPKRTPAAEMFKAMADGVSNLKKGDVFEINTKDFTASDGDDNYQIYAEERVDAIKYDPNHFSRLRSILPTGQTSGGSVRYNIESAETDSAAAKAKGAAATQSSVTLKNVHQPVQTLMNVLTLPNEWLDDTPMIESYLSTRLVANLMDVEDSQILTGAGTGANFSGVNTQGTTATQANLETLYGGLADAFAEGDANKYDALVATRAGMMNQGFAPSVVILNPIDYASLLLIKSDNNEYVLQQTVSPAGSVETFWAGMRVVQHQSQASDTFTMIDTTAVQYWMNGGMTFSFGYNASDFSSNEITARALQRGAVTVYRPNGARNQTFTNAINALDAS